MVALLITINGREAFAFQPEYLPALRTGRYFDLARPSMVELPLVCRNTASGKNGIKCNVQAVAVQLRMCFFLDQNNEVARTSAAFTRIAFTVNANCILPARRRVFQSKRFLLRICVLHLFAGSTFTGYRCSFAITVRAGGNGLHLSEESILRSPRALPPQVPQVCHAVLIFRAPLPAQDDRAHVFCLDRFGGARGYFFKNSISVLREGYCPGSTAYDSRETFCLLRQRNFQMRRRRKCRQTG